MPAIDTREMLARRGSVLRDAAGELVAIDGLEQGQVEAGIQGAFAVFGLAVTGQGDQLDAVAEAGADAAGDFVPVKAGQADIDEGDVGIAAPGDFDAVRSVFGDVDVVAPDLEQPLER